VITFKGLLILWDRMSNEALLDLRCLTSHSWRYKFGYLRVGSVDLISVESETLGMLAGL
jgi:hypothetical protein